LNWQVESQHAIAVILSQEPAKVGLAALMISLHCLLMSANPVAGNAKMESSQYHCLTLLLLAKNSSTKMASSPFAFQVL
jgi:hypothetical protein